MKNFLWFVLHLKAVFTVLMWLPDVAIFCDQKGRMTSSQAHNWRQHGGMLPTTLDPPLVSCSAKIGCATSKKLCYCRDHTTGLSVEMLQLQIIPFEKDCNRQMTKYIHQRSWQLLLDSVGIQKRASTWSSHLLWELCTAIDCQASRSKIAKFRQNKKF